MMQRLQSLFDQLAGIHQSEAALRSQAWQIFGENQRLPMAIETPACWRRKARISRRSGVHWSVLR